MTFEKARIGDRMYDVLDINQYVAHPDLYDPRYTAIKYGDGCVYPIRSSTDNRPGFYSFGYMWYIKPAQPHEFHIYSQQNIINFSDTSNIKEIIEAQRELNNEERAILTTIDNLFVPNIGPNDSPEIRALKEAVIEKKIDIDKYEPRFGPNFNNDKRLLRRDSMTLGKMKKFADALDMKMTLTIEDADPNVPNPIGRKITVVITGGEQEEE